MSDAPLPSTPKSAYNNWISVIGAVVAVGALFSFALLVAMGFAQGEYVFRASSRTAADKREE